MNTSKRVMAVVLMAAAAIALATRPIAGDEGMWTFDNPPLKLLAERYNFTPTKAWLDHLRLSSVRFNDGGSGSFVSPNGLVLTNHHVAAGQLQKVSSAQKDHMQEGLYARTPGEELKAPDLELNVLRSVEDVTARVERAVKPGASEKHAQEARKAEIARLEKESLDTTGLRSDVVPLYHGGEYWLYRYKKYTDVRIVFAPERQAAFFGGDPDNFTFPRYDLDMALVRVYEQDKPIQSPHYLKWNANGLKQGDLVFVSGHPGTTSRLYTLAQLEHLRDHQYPLWLETLKRRVDALRKYSAQGPEQARQAGDLIFGLENSIKALTGEYAGLQDPRLFARKNEEEQDFRRRVADRPDWQKAYGGAWERIAEAQAGRRDILTPWWHRSLGRSFARLPRLALQIVQYVAEVKKPDADRLDGYHDAQIDSLKLTLLSPAPAYPGMDQALLTDAWTQALAALGPEDPYVKAALGGRTPQEAARAAIAGSTLGEAAFRKSLVDGGDSAVAASTDPLIALARKVDPFVREQRKRLEETIESVETAAGERIGRARFAVYGKSMYPDATFTLRLAFGTVKGYPMNGTEAPWKTTMFGLFDRAHSFDLAPPFDLPQRYLARRNTLDLTTPMNFVSTADIIGGNSGSPVVNRAGELVGLIFDGNIESLIGNFMYDDERSRAVAVHPAAMTEALRKLYDAAPLADELEGKR